MLLSSCVLPLMHAPMPVKTFEYNYSGTYYQNDWFGPDRDSAIQEAREHMAESMAKEYAEGWEVVVITTEPIFFANGTYTCHFVGYKKKR